MSKFGRAYRGALLSSSPPLSQAQAAAVAELLPSVVSRLINGETLPRPHHVRALLRAITDPADREHCVREYLHDCCPPEYQEQLSISLGAVSEPREPRATDRLTRDLARLDQLADDNPALRRLIGLLIELLGGK